MVPRLDGNYIETFTGKQFWPLSPIWEDVDIVDIAHALSNKCRYTGHTREFYSVAQHSVLVSGHAPTKVRLQALLHDAAEAYLPDIAFPLRGAFDNFAAAEELVHKAVAKRFNIPFPWADDIKDIDRRITRDEAAELMKSQGRFWPGSTSRLGIVIEAWGPKEAERRFLEHYDKLVAYLGDVPDPYHFERLTHLHNLERRGG